ncbi:MAG: hypothetical protein JJU34_18330 [Lunatimonas sp.]|uniref:hypothetical protein n=1 Tax=Lunatimonas sp. TaxID=2060141 RepID=UPI00263A5F08|nr:hypothetical protein [Lunatimonas sp.]MCC5939244.1 hypothetical protein [Lunatimonas sp.]
MSLYIGALIILAIVVALVLIFKKVFNRNSDEVSTRQEISSKEVIKKEVSEFDPKTGEEKKEA